MMIQTLLRILAMATLASPAAAEDALIARGAYLARIMDCAGYHMPRDATGTQMFEAGLSGGTLGFEIPGLGTVWPPNLIAWPTASRCAASWPGARHG